MAANELRGIIEIALNVARTAASCTLVRLREAAEKLGCLPHCGQCTRCERKAMRRRQEDFIFDLLEQSVAVFGVELGRNVCRARSSRIRIRRTRCRWTLKAPFVYITSCRPCDVGDDVRTSLQIVRLIGICHSTDDTCLEFISHIVCPLKML